jgi:hypothetical protein
LRRAQSGGLTRVAPLDLLVDARRFLLATADWFAFDHDAIANSVRCMGDSDPEEAEDLLQLNFERRMFLARYGKQSVLQWDDVPLTDMNRYVNALAELIKAESIDRKASEDQ